MRLPTGLRRADPSCTKTRLPCLYTVPTRLENYISEKSYKRKVPGSPTSSKEQFMAEWSLIGKLSSAQIFVNSPNISGAVCSFLALKGYHVITRLALTKPEGYRPESHHRDSSSFSPCLLNRRPKCYQDRLSN